MKARKGEAIVCNCAQPVGSFLNDVEDGASISQRDISISLPWPSLNDPYVCPKCQTPVAERFSDDRWRVMTKRGWVR